ncbi:glycopeptide antibiotics resistance protein [Gracilibacillus halotolerans]|uniref:Glycopeptide antibiotics resistance protein n=1 Tax=Gracilibacillus halotolerans TaxID=74386 RepID=A0A841RMH5_9BACI|nr:VanZ family protein [Gracilibacillus halotolerans]MBB6512134.1 glycopeptide antibiotics resistance protein [Gracilibacillus halotolerans]
MKKIIRVIINISFIFYLLALVTMLFLGMRSNLWTNLSLIEYIKSSTNIIPFKTISTYVIAIFDGSMNIDIPIRNLLGNLIMFFPMGIYLPYYIKKINKLSRFIGAMTVLLFLIEITQLVSRRGSFDIDDFILNMVGSLIGFVIWNTRIVQKLIKH